MYALALLGLAASASAMAMPVSPAAAAPAGCQMTYPGSFTITVVNATTASSKLIKRQDFQPSGTLSLNLNNGVLLDKYGRTGYIASNRQFQFDKPAQPGYIYNSGFSVCPNNTLALGGSTVFYACKVDTYYNLYDESINNLCGPVYLETSMTSSSGGSGAASEASDGQPGASSAVGAKTDGQPTATVIASGIGEKTDGQPTATVIASGVGEKTDGQPTVTAIASGVGEKTDGQPTVTAIASGVGEKTDGQPTVTAIASGVGEKTDGQPTVTAIYNSTATLVPYTGAAAGYPKVELFAVGAAALAAAML